MAFIIQNTFFIQAHLLKCELEPQIGRQMGQRMIWSCQQKKAYRFPKKEGGKLSKQCIQSSPFSRFYLEHIEPHIFLQYTHLGLKICANLMRDGRLVRLLGGRSLEILKLFTKCNNFLPFDGFCLMLDSRTGLLEMHSIQMFTHIGQSGSKKIIIELIDKMSKMIRQQMAIMLDLVDEGYHREASEKDKRYHERLIGEGAQTLKLRELISISHLDVKLLEKSAADRPKLVKALTQFLLNRGRTVGLKGSLLGQQANLYRVCAENDYFSTRPMSLQSFNGQFSREYDAYQPRVLAPENIDKRDNIYLFNTIRIRNAHLVNLEQPHCQGGFSKIYVSRLQFQYAQSTNPVFEGLQSKPRSASRSKWVEVQPSNIPYLSKYLAIKVNKNESDYDKIAHQKKIVQHFRVESSPYLVKYYHSVQKHFPYRRYLLMDFMGNVPTLSEYNHLHQQSFSLNSKMHLLIHLSAALKFLSAHNVVHMDLSSLNVVVVHRLLTKIIDFGEAYHPMLDKDSPNNYNPGHTMPYAPPETFQPVKKFACSSDMFSLGIILFRLIMNDFPFQPSQQLRGEYEGKTYMRRFMLAPERMAELGWSRQNKLLMLLVERCLRQDETQRPIPYWLCVILTKIFQSLR